MSSLTTDFNVSPYFDDYDEDKRYSRILYRPAVAVQARELTQSQTILQAQIQRFGDHIFKDGSIVDGTAITYYPNVHFISVSDTFNANTNRILSSIANNNYLVTNMDATQSSNAVRAVIKLAIDGNQIAAPYTNRIYFDYIATGNNTSTGDDVHEFAPGDTLYIYNANQSKLGTLVNDNIVDTIVTLSSNATFTSNGYAYCVGVSDGTIYQKGFFSKVPAQLIAVGNTLSTNTTNYVIGFDTNETIITENNDATLYDNALGYDNENAPGAHRLQLTPTLVSKLKSDTANNKNFFSIIEFGAESKPSQQKQDAQYAALETMIAGRTYDESGDYVIRPFNVDTLTSSDPNTFNYEISSGTAYVRGNKIDKLNSILLETPRANTVDYSNNQIITANYGNYVICNEFLGTFNQETLISVSLYDTAQLSLSQNEGIDGGLTGTSIGTANIRAVEYFSGTRGSSDSSYYLYLTNIQMNTGKSFSSVRSIVQGTAARADIILQNGNAVLQNASYNSLVWDSGITAVANLKASDGSTQTSYTFNEIVSGTLTTAGIVNITLDTAGPGVTSETLEQASGSSYTSSSILNGYNVFLGSGAAYTANVTGNATLTTGSYTVTGISSSLFTTELQANTLIRISDSGGNVGIHKIASIANNTSLTLATALTISTNTSGTSTYRIARYFANGSSLPIQSVNVTSSSAFNVNTGLTFTGSTTVNVSFPVKRNTAVATSKIINKDRYLRINCASHSANSIGPWGLGLVDVLKLKGVYIQNTNFTGITTTTDRSSWFTLDNGQRDDMYDHARLYVKPQYASYITSTSRIAVKLDHFTANTTAGVGFYTVESYPIDDANTANATAITTGNIPYYNNVDLRSSIDFRVRKIDTANSVSDPDSALISMNPANSSTSFDVYTSGQRTIAPDRNFQASYRYYLPRYDLITINSNGDTAVQKGVPAKQPRPPFVENDQSIIAEAYVPGYPSLTQRESETYNSFKNSIKVNLKGNRRYTMKDIAGLEERIKRIEYYTVLNTLEQQAKDLTIPDANGLNRFKNGIFADPFNSHNNGNVSDLEYKIAIDPVETVARPFFTTTPIDYKYNSSSSTNVTQANSYVMLNYTSENFVSQNYATKYRVCCESAWSWNGLLDLYPSQDFFRDENTLPNQNINLDLTQEARTFAASPFGTSYGSWRTVNTSSRSSTSTQGNQIVTTTNTTSTQTRTVSQMTVDTVTQNITLGSYVTDVSIQPYMRSRIVAFQAFNMKPNTRLYAFFDTVNVSANCAPGVRSGTTLSAVPQGREDLYITKTGAWGDPLVSNSSGGVAGVFSIPAQTFRTGDRLFQLTNVSNLLTGTDAILSKSGKVYSASSVSVTKQTETLTLQEPVVRYSNTVQSVNTSVLTSRSRERPSRDPIAQSFSITDLPSNVTGIMLTQIGLYFQSKDATLGCSVFVCEMTNNQPDNSKILGKGYLTSSSITANPTTPTTETIFVLDNPIFLANEVDYAFIVEPDGSSPDYTVWVGETGGTDIVSGAQVFSNPYSGILFISANEKTWTAIQKEDMMFNLYRAKFTATSGSVIFNNEDDEYITYTGLTRFNGTNPIAIGDVVYTASALGAPNTATNAPYGRVSFVDEATNRIYIDSSNGGFSNTTGTGLNPRIGVYRVSNPTDSTQANTTTVIATANITLLNSFDYQAISPNFSVLQPSRTSLSYGVKGSNSSYADSAYTTIYNGSEYEFADYTRTIRSKSSEGGTKSSTFQINLTTETNYSSPIINLRRKSMLAINNIINNDTTNEHTRYGNSSTKYISKQVVLADGQDAEDLKVYLTAYRPVNTDIAVYAKFLNAQDPESFDNKVWSLMSYANNTEASYSSPTDVTNFIEYQFIMPTANSVAQGAFSNSSTNTAIAMPGTVNIANNSTALVGTGTQFANSLLLQVGDTIRISVNNSYYAYRTVVSIADDSNMVVNLGLPATNAATLFYTYNSVGNQGIVEYNNSANSRFIGYKNFAIKVVLLSSNPAKVPRLQDVRAIALQI